MRKGDPLDAIISKQVLMWDYLATSEENLEALERLTKDGQARTAWERLAALVEGDDFAMAVSSIARAAALSHLKHSDRRTRAEIREAATDAADLAKRLVRLIENNRALQSFERASTLSCTASEFIEYLSEFSEYALAQKDAEPPIQKPKAKNAAQHVFAGEVCAVLNHFSGSPHHDIAAAIVSAAFNEAIDTELVKSWWKRRRDKT